MALWLMMPLLCASRGGAIRRALLANSDGTFSDWSDNVGDADANCSASNYEEPVEYPNAPNRTRNWCGHLEILQEGVYKYTAYKWDQLGKEFDKLGDAMPVYIEDVALHLAHIEADATGNGICKPLLYSAIVASQAKEKQIPSRFNLEFAAKRNARAACFCYRSVAEMLKFSEFTIDGDEPPEKTISELCDAEEELTNEDLFKKLVPNGIMSTWDWAVRG